METPNADTLIKHHVTFCDVVTRHKLSYPIRYMTAEEELERLELRIANTSENLRKRVLSFKAKSNGDLIVAGEVRNGDIITNTEPYTLE